jgi:hypothetical protein
MPRFDGRKEFIMSSKSKEARLEQKAYWEKKLNHRMSELSEKGLEKESIEKDRAIKKIRAEIRAAGNRLKVIENLEKKQTEMAEAKAKKAAGPKKEKKKNAKPVEETAEMSKRQKKKAAKREKKKSEPESQ